MQLFSGSFPQLQNFNRQTGTKFSGAEFVRYRRERDRNVADPEHDAVADKYEPRDVNGKFEMVDVHTGKVVKVAHVNWLGEDGIAFLDGEDADIVTMLENSTAFVADDFIGGPGESHVRSGQPGIVSVEKLT